MFQPVKTPAGRDQSSPKPPAQFCVCFTNTLLDSLVVLMIGQLWIPYFDPWGGLIAYMPSCIFKRLMHFALWSLVIETQSWMWKQRSDKVLGWTSVLGKIP